MQLQQVFLLQGTVPSPIMFSTIASKGTLSGRFIYGVVNTLLIFSVHLFFGQTTALLSKIIQQYEKLAKHNIMQSYLKTKRIG